MWLDSEEEKEEEEEEERLLALQQPLTIEDTALGKERRNIKQDSFAAIRTMNAAELGALIEAALEAQARFATEELTIVDLSNNEVPSVSSSNSADADRSVGSDAGSKSSSSAEESPPKPPPRVTRTQTGLYVHKPAPKS